MKGLTFKKGRRRGKESNLSNYSRWRNPVEVVKREGEDFGVDSVPSENKPEMRGEWKV